MTEGYLLDTHIWIWLLTGSTRLPATLRRSIESAPDAPWLSPVSLWEFTLLVKKGRLEVPRLPADWIDEALRVFPVREAAFTFEVAEVAARSGVPGDPADALLAATAIAHDLTLITVDRKLRSVRGLRTRSK